MEQDKDDRDGKNVKDGIQKIDGIQNIDVKDVKQNIDVIDSIQNINGKDGLQNINLKDGIQNIDVKDVKQNIDVKDGIQNIEVKESKIFKNLVISGGGSYFFQFYGIIKYLEMSNLLNTITKFVGVSAGSLAIFLIIIGYKYHELENFLIKFDFNKIFDLHFEKILIDEKFKGLTNGENFDKLIKKFLHKKDLDENITLKQLYDKTNKDFIIGITNITKDRVEYINHLNYPDMPVYLALRITCCIPILYEPILYKDCYYIDGGLKDNFPIQLIPDEDLKDTIAIVLSPFKETYDISEMETITFLFHMYRTISSDYIKGKIEKYTDKCKLFIVSTGNQNFINYKIDENNRKELLELGYEQCRKSFTS